MFLIQNPKNASRGMEKIGKQKGVEVRRHNDKGIKVPSAKKETS